MEPVDGSRVVKLGEVEFFSRTYKDAALVVGGNGYVGLSRAKAVRLIEDISAAQGVQSKPGHLIIINSEKNPGDVVGIPTMEASPHHLALEWYNNGRSVRVNMARLMVAKRLVIPEGTNMVISLYAEQDSQFGAGVGMKLQGASFEPVRKRGKRLKAPATGSTAPATGSTPAAPGSTGPAPAPSGGKDGSPA